jgi:thiopeptide-type bacteriocin biosynthesis protein
MYRAIDALLLRASPATFTLELLPWPNLTDESSDAVEEWRDWLRAVWAQEYLADAVALASPVLARQVAKICQGGGDVRQTRRAVRSTVRYLLRLAGRATPFGQFAGIAPGRLGEFALRWGDAHQPVARPSSGWLAAVVADLEWCAPLLRRLTVVVNTPLVYRDDKLICPLRQRDRDGDDEPVLIDVTVRMTKAVQTALGHAHTPVLVAHLVAKLHADSPNSPVAVIEAMVRELVAAGVLRTSLSSPTVGVEPLDHVIAQIEVTGAEEMPEVAARLHALRAIRDGLRRHNEERSAASRRKQRVVLGAQIGQVRDPVKAPLAVDLRLDVDVSIPADVIREVEAAAAALVRLTPFPQGAPMWAEYHGAFIERYGNHAVVPLLELVNPDTGLGFPASYRGSARTVRADGLSARDQRLFVLAQKAALCGHAEVALTEASLTSLAGDSAPRQIPPHLELLAEIHSVDQEALRRGAFAIRVVGTGRAAGASIGRFIRLLRDPAREHFQNAFAELTTMSAGALLAQVSSPALRAESDNLAHTPRLLAHSIPVAAYHEAEPAVVSLDDLAISGDASGLVLFSLARQRAVEPVVFHSVEYRYHSHPLARFLCEITTARAAVCLPFSWGAASDLPFLPRLRHGRTVLSPARWNLTAADLPARRSSWKVWREGMQEWARQIRVPRQVQLVEFDNRLRLDMNLDAHLWLLRDHLDRHGHARLDEAPDPAGYGWLGGHAHEIAVPLTSTSKPRQHRPRAGHTMPTTRMDGALPGASPWLYAKLYGHPDRATDILGRVPELIAHWASPPPWWFIRYRDHSPHLRLRIQLPHADAYGEAASHLGTWAAALRGDGILGLVTLDTYVPETGRYGDGDAMTAAEAAFAADSAAALAQLHLAAAGAPIDAVTAAGLVDLATAFAGNVSDGMRWLIEDLPHEPGPTDRALRDIAIRLADPGEDFAALRTFAGADSVLNAWRHRREALARYRHRLAAQRDPDMVLASLLHLHHVRMLGLDPERERLGRRLARATALRWTATKPGSPL